MNWTIGFSPLVPDALLIAAGALALLAGLPHLLRGHRGAILRLAALSLLVLALANPVLKQEERQPLANIVVVVVDESTSQKIANRPELSARIRSQLTAALDDLPNMEVRWVRTQAGTEGQREETNLYAALQRGLGEVPGERLAGVFLITDGQIHDMPENVRELGIEAPVHALLTGREGEFDRHIRVITSPRFGLVGSEQTAEIEIVASGAKPAPGETARLRIQREGEDEQRLEVGIGQKITVPFRFNRAGKTYMELAVDPVPGELTEANNRIVLEAQGVRENLRVLLVSGEPHAGERTWRNLLRSDASVDLVHFTILRPPEKQDGTPINQLSLIAFPTRELFAERLDDFDLIIFDRYQRRGILPLIYLDNVARYVREGGAVLVAAGPDFASPLSIYGTPLADILPAEPTGRIVEAPFKPRISPEGRRHPVTSDLPGAGDAQNAPGWGRWFRTIDAEPKAEAQVLMSGPEDKPLLVLSRQGEGRVAIFLSDHVWLWARGYEGGGPHADILRRLAHWLMKEPDLEEEALRVNAGRDSLSITRTTMNDDVGPVDITLPDGQTMSVQLEPSSDGVWRQSVSAPMPGLYRLKSGDLSALAHVGAANSREMTDVTTTDVPLRPLLDETGGGTFWTAADTAGAVSAVMPRLSMVGQSRQLHGQGWAGILERNAYVVTGLSLTPLYAGALALALLLGFIALAWYRESR
jgi:hypothetical protein